MQHNRQQEANGADTCPICRWVAEPGDEAVFDDAGWRAGVLPGLEVPGWIVLALKRHATSTSELSAEEAARLGVLVVELSSAIERATAAERVYVQAWGEQARHVHVLLAARGAEVPVEHRHAAFWGHRADYVDSSAAHRAAAAVRDALPVPSP